MTNKELPMTTPQGRCPGCGATKRITKGGAWVKHSRNRRGLLSYGTEPCPHSEKPAPTGAHAEWLAERERSAQASFQRHTLEVERKRQHLATAEHELARAQAALDAVVAAAKAVAGA